MGSPQSCVCWHRNIHIIISLLFLLVSSLSHVRSIAEGRAIIPTPLESTKVQELGVPENVEMIRSQIGSRPPSCTRRCRDCGGHCEAVQVPVVLHDSQHQRRKRSSRFSAAAATSAAVSKNVALASEEETSNYKPISWKCKCGNFIFNP